MTDDGSPRGDETAPAATGETTAEDALAPAATLTRARTLIALLRSHVRTFEHMLLDGLEDHAAVSAQLEDLRRTADRLALAIDVAGRVPPRSAPPTEGREHGRGVATPAIRSEPRYAITIELRASHLRALTESGALPPWDSGDPLKVTRTVQSILDRWSGLYGVPARGAALGAALADRRAGRDRRSGSPRPNCLLSYIAGTPLDRRKGDRRTRPHPDTVGNADASPPPTSADNLVRIDGARQARRRERPTRGGLASARVVSFRDAGGYPGWPERGVSAKGNDRSDEIHAPRPVSSPQVDDLAPPTGPDGDHRDR